MAKKTVRKRAGVRKKPAVARARAAAPACRLTLPEGSPNAQAATGSRVALFTHEHIGAVMFAKAEYAGKQLVPAGQAVSKIEFDVVAGPKTLKMVFVFSASTMGRGELRENCGAGASQFLRPLAGDEPLQLLRIVGS